jgi:hypothetical protein
MKSEQDGFDLSRLQMNKVGRDDAADKVIKPKLDSATKTRNTILIAVVVVAIVGLIGVQFMRSGKIWESPEDKAKQFAPEDHKFDKSE